MNIKAYCQLARLHKPSGFLLLWCPTAWALWIAYQGHPPVHITCLFLLGTLLMRSAGCVLNDIADRQIDGHVARTHRRPLPSGAISLLGAFAFLILLLLGALIILLQLPTYCFVFALCSLIVTIIYPFAKRVIKAPQLILGIAFSMSIPMVYLAAGVSFNSDMYILLLANFLWIMSYDTIYALADKADDYRLGVQSTAIFMGEFDRLFIGLCQFISHGLWVILALKNQWGNIFWLGWITGVGLLIYQQVLLSKKMGAKAFSLNAGYGLVLWVSIALNFWG